MSKATLRDIIRRKAWYLETLALQTDFPDLLGSIREKRKMIDDMPVRGFRQREKQVGAHDALDNALERLALKLGNQVLDSYAFVSEHRRYLGKQTRKKLKLEKR